MVSAAIRPEIDEQFPFPDYKFVSCVVTEDLMQSSPQLAGDLATSKIYENYIAHKASYFPDILAMHSVAQAGLLREFSNSFLFLSQGNNPSPRLFIKIRRRSNFSCARKLRKRKAGAVLATTLWCDIARCQMSR